MGKAKTIKREEQTESIKRKTLKESGTSTQNEKENFKKITIKGQCLIKMNKKKYSIALG